MLPLIVLVVATLVLWTLGHAGVGIFRDTATILRVALGLMFLLTASAHWGKRRADLIRMVPAAFPRPDILVTITGVLEILGAIGLFIPAASRAAGICLALLLILIFPANVRAARQSLTIAGHRVPSLPVRAGMQMLFIAALVGAILLK